MSIIGTQATPATPAQIKQIHITQSAREGILYYETTGKVYKGLPGGFLREEKQLVAAETTLDQHSKLLETHSTQISDLEDRTSELESTKASKCFTLAMSIAL